MTQSRYILVSVGFFGIDLLLLYNINPLTPKFKPGHLDFFCYARKAHLPFFYKMLAFCSEAQIVEDL